EREERERGERERKRRERVCVCEIEGSRRHHSCQLEKQKTEKDKSHNITKQKKRALFCKRSRDGMCLFVPKGMCKLPQHRKNCSCEMTDTWISSPRCD